MVHEIVISEYDCCYFTVFIDGVQATSEETERCWAIWDYMAYDIFKESISRYISCHRKYENEDTIHIIMCASGGLDIADYEVSEIKNLDLSAPKKKASADSTFMQTIRSFYDDRLLALAKQKEGDDT